MKNAFVLLKNAMFLISLVLLAWVPIIYLLDTAFLDYEPAAVVAVLPTNIYAATGEKVPPSADSVEYLIFVGKYHQSTTKKIFEAAQTGQVLGAWTRITKRVITKKIEKQNPRSHRTPGFLFYIEIYVPTEKLL